MTAIASVRADGSPVRDVGTQPALSALRGSPWFAGWPPSALTALSAVSSLRSFAAGQPVTQNDGTDQDRHPMLVIKGRVRAVRRAGGGREVTLETFRAGDLATDALFPVPTAGPGPTGPAAWTSALCTDWLAAETCLLLFIPRDALLAQLAALPEAALALAQDYERRLAHVMALATGLVLADVEARLRHALTRLAREDGEPGPEGTVVARCPTQQELGNSIGACRETVSRIIADLSRKGLVTLRGRKLVLASGFFKLTAQAA